MTASSPAPAAFPKRSSAAPPWWLWLAFVATAVVTSAITTLVVVDLDLDNRHDDNAASATIDTGTTLTTSAGNDEPETTDAPSDGSRWSDPGGSATMVIDPNWDELPTVNDLDLASWSVTDPSIRTYGTITVVGSPDSGKALELEIDDMVAVLPPGADILDTSAFRGADGELRGRVEYTVGRENEQGLIVIATRDGGDAVYVKLEADTQSYQMLRESIEPFLRSLSLSAN